MAVHHSGHQGDAPFRRYVWQSDQPRVGKIVAVDQFTEVSVYRYQDTSFRRGNFQQGPVARVGPKALRFLDVVPLSAEPFSQTSSGTAVYQELHALTFSDGNRSQGIPRNYRVGVGGTGADIVQLKVGVVVQNSLWRNSLGE